MVAQNKYLSSRASPPPSSSSSDLDGNLVSTLAPRQRRRARLPILLVCLVAVIGGLFHCAYVARLHEGHLSFSLLSNTERELTFRSEMGFYYSFFKQLILVDSFMDGLTTLFNDTVTEYPVQLGCLNATSELGYIPSVANCSSPHASVFFSRSGVNVLERFNIFPEFVLAASYRFGRHWNFLSSECFNVSVGEETEYYAFGVNPTVFQSPTNSNSHSPTTYLGSGASNRIVISCVGLREPPIFYVNAVYSLAGLSVFSLALSGWMVASSGATNPCISHALLSVWGSILPVVFFFFNHGEATRVQWTPPLRESFSFPFFLLQQTVIIWLLRDSLSKSRRYQPVKYMGLVAVLLLVQLPWQFAQFALLTQLLAMLATYAVTLMTRPCHNLNSLRLFVAFCLRIEHLIMCQLLALMISFFLQFGNRMLLASAYLPLLVGSFLGMTWHRRRLLSALVVRSVPWKRNSFGPLYYLCSIAMVILMASSACALAVRFILGDVGDGAHILQILKLKILGSRFKTFHTQLYTCALEFDFLPWSTLRELTRTFLLPFAGLAVFTAITELAWPLFEYMNKKSVSPRASTNDRPSFYCHPPLIRAKETCMLVNDIVSVFIVFQLLMFAILAGFIMRLKLFFVPQLCLTVAILAQPRMLFGSHKLYLLFLKIPFIGRLITTTTTTKTGSKLSSSQSSRKSITVKNFVIHAIFIIVVALSSVVGMENMQFELSKKGQFSAFEMETLLHWAQQLPKREDGGLWVFSGAMPTMATLRLGLISERIAIRDSKFAITNHPHYENDLLRARNELASSICSRKQAASVWSIYHNVLKTDFIVIERMWCAYRHPTPGCNSNELWDLFDPNFSNRGSLCEHAFEKFSEDNPLKDYFARVFLALDQSIAVLAIIKPQPNNAL